MMDDLQWAAERCVRRDSPLAHCRQCADNCPASAVTVTGDRLQVDEDRCTGCGICVATCPTTVFSAPLPPLPGRDGGETRFAACRKAVAEDLPGVLPCVNRIGVFELARLYEAGLRTLQVACGPCDGCPLAAGQPLTAAIDQFNALMQARHQPAIALTKNSAADWRRYHATANFDDLAPALDRRAILRLAFARDDPSGADKDSDRTDALARLQRQDQEAITLWTPIVDPARCSGCMVCTHFCKTRSLTSFNAGTDKIGIKVDPAACTGCGLCMDVCDDEAISVMTLEPCAVRQLEFHARYCGECGAVYYSPAEQPHRDWCSICAVRARRANRWQIGA